MGSTMKTIQRDNDKAQSSNKQRNRRIGKTRNRGRDQERANEMKAKSNENTKPMKQRRK